MPTGDGAARWKKAGSNVRITKKLTGEINLGGGADSIKHSLREQAQNSKRRVSLKLRTSIFSSRAKILRYGAAARLWHGHNSVLDELNEPHLDSPLLSALYLLRQLGAHLEGLGSKRKQEADVVKRVIKLLGTGNATGLNKSQVDHTDPLIAGLNDTQCHEWLGIMHKVKAENTVANILSRRRSSQSAPPSQMLSALAEMSSTPGVRGSEGEGEDSWEDGGEDEADDQVGPISTDAVTLAPAATPERSAPTRLRASSLKGSTSASAPSAAPSASLAEGSRSLSLRQLYVGDFTLTEESVLPPQLGKAIAAEGERRARYLLSGGLLAWDYDAWELDRLTGGNGLSAFGWALSLHHSWPKHIGATPEALWGFFAAVQQGYRDVPYHNRVHATDVTHATNWLVTQCPGLRGVAETPHMMFASLIAAMVHDIDHDGHNVGWHVGIGSEWAILYSDKSPLEMHHLAIAFNLIKRFGITDGLPLDLRRQVRDRIIGMVLGTDFSNHVPILNEFKVMLKSGPPPPYLDPELTHPEGPAADAEGTGKRQSTTMRNMSSLLHRPSISSIHTSIHAIGAISSPISRASISSPISRASSRASAAAALPGEQSRSKGDKGEKGDTSGAAKGDGQGVSLGPGDVGGRVRRWSFPPATGSSDLQDGSQPKRHSNPELHSSSRLRRQPEAWSRTRFDAEKNDTLVFSASQDTMTATEQMAVAVMVIKVADLSYITKGQEYALPWVERCLDEFCNQGEEEAALGLPVGYDRKTLDKPKSQVGFYAFMVRPMYECLDLLAAIPSQLTALQRLTDYWSEQIGKK